MKKMAIFVEGHTEFHLMTRLVEELIGFGKLHLELHRQHGGNIRQFQTRGAPSEAASATLMIVNCDEDGTVKSSILERKDKLNAVGYETIIGLQDLYPKPYEDLSRFQEGLNNGLNDAKIKIIISIAVMEVEAWILNESTHYTKISSALDMDTIESRTGFNPQKDRAETAIRHPADFLNKIYQIDGISYKKRQNEIARIVNSIDYENLYTTVRAMSKSLDSFLIHLDNFQSQMTQ